MSIIGNVPAEVTTSLSVEEDQVNIHDPAVTIATRDAGVKFWRGHQVIAFDSWPTVDQDKNQILRLEMLNSPCNVLLCPHRDHHTILEIIC